MSRRHAELCWHTLCLHRCCVRATVSPLIITQFSSLACCGRSTQIYVWYVCMFIISCAFLIRLLLVSVWITSRHFPRRCIPILYLIVVQFCNDARLCWLRFCWWFNEIDCYSNQKTFIDILWICCSFWQLWCKGILKLVLICVRSRVRVNFKNRGTIVVLNRYASALCFLEFFWVVVLSWYFRGTDEVRS